MKIDWLRLLQDFGLPVWDSENSKGKVTSGYIGTSCPFCGSQGPHLGFHRSGERKPSCWRCGTHSIYDTVRILTGQHPKPLLKEYGTVSFILPEYESKIIKRPKTIQVPGVKEPKQIHLDYLNNRGFDGKYVWLKYDLSWTRSIDPYPYRIIFPIKLRGKDVSYQGRGYSDQIKPKYLTCKPENEVVFHKDTFFNIDNCKKEFVLITEGVFDTIRFGDNCMASFGTSITDSQLVLLKEKYKQVFFLYDNEPEAQKKAKTACIKLNGFGIGSENICLEGEGDPGDLTEDEALWIKKELKIL